MKLIFVTQVLDRENAILGFVSRWVAGLAQRCDAVRVLALEVGDTSDLPDNVDWRVVGRKGRVGRYFRYRSFVHAACKDGFDTLLTHMVPRYSVVAAPWTRKLGVGHFLWYTHKGVDARLRNAVAVVDKVFTASPESMRVETPKKVVTGHGIDLSHFATTPAPGGPPVLLSAGRLTPAKDPLTVLAALANLRSKGLDVKLEWAGGTLASGDADYERAVRARVEALALAEHVRFLGDVPYPEFPAAYQRATLFVSASRTGSVDKVVLEAMAVGRPPVTCNESFPPLFAELGDAAEGLVFPPGDADALTQRLSALLAQPADAREALGVRLRALVQRDHEVDALMGRLVAEMKSVRE